MMKLGLLAERARKRLERVAATRAYQRYCRPAIAVLRWEGIILVAALGFAFISALATQWFILFIVLAAAFLGLAWVRAFDESAKGRRFRARAERLGLWVWGLLLLIIGVAIFWRFSARWGSVVFALAYILVGVSHLRWLRWRTTPMARQFKQVQKAEGEDALFLACRYGVEGWRKNSLDELKRSLKIEAAFEIANHTIGVLQHKNTFQLRSVLGKYRP